MRFRHAPFCVPGLLPLLFAAVTAQAQAPAVPPAACGPPPDGAICAMGAWFDFARLDATTTTGAIVGRFVLQLPAGQEIYAKFHIVAPDGTRGAELVVIGTAETVAANVPPQFEGDPVSLLGPPMLTGQLVAGLLQVAVPEGPAALKGSRSVRLTEPRRYVVTATPASRAVYGAPWSLSGTVRAVGKGEIAFDVTLRYRRVGRSGVADVNDAAPLKLEGRLSYPAQRSRLPDSLDLDGWRIVRAGSVRDGVATLGELRRAVTAKQQ